ncbi:hypothetical protein Ancab_032703 [Ancistrocladus abbreviatus]
MASVISFTVGKTPTQSVCSNETLIALAGSPASRTRQLEPRMKSLLKQRISVKGKPLRYEVRKCNLHVPSAQTSDSSFSILSLSDTVKQFYTCINEKNMDQLAELITNDCYLEDCSFPNTFHGKKEVLKFFKQLTASTEWKEDQIPFTRGFSMFKCSKEGERLLIRRAQIVIESPIKSGGLVMALLKTLTSLFDDFPKAAEWFLKRPWAIFQTLLAIYNLFLRPFINPVLTCYINLVKFMTWLLGYIISVLHCISKLFQSGTT